MVASREITDPKKANIARAFFAGYIIFALYALATFLIILFPTCAYATISSLPKTDITAQIQTDGSLHVIEQRVVEFSDTPACVAWSFSNLPSDATLNVNLARYAMLTTEGNVDGEWMTLNETSFALEWRETQTPDIVAYSFDEPQNTVYTFLGNASGRYVVELDYTVASAVLIYRDVSELKWTFVAEAWELPSQNVTVTLSLPVPQGETATPWQSVYAWGHGPKEGTVDLTRAGMIVYRNEEIYAGQYLDAHVLFPSSWMTHATGSQASTNRATLRLSEALAEEAVWADTWSAQQIQTYAGYCAGVLLCALLLATVIVLYLIFGREYIPDFTEKYCRSLPGVNLSIAAFGRLLRWNREDIRDMSTTLMTLAHKGVLLIEPCGSSWQISRVPTADTSTLSELEIAALETMFDKTVFEDPTLPPSTRTTNAEDTADPETAQAQVSSHPLSRELAHPEALIGSSPADFLQKISHWQSILSSEMSSHGFFEMRSMRLQKIVLVVSGVLALVAVVSFVAGNTIFATMFLPTALACALIANYLPRRTREGNNIAARCKALRNWLRDLPQLTEEPDILEESKPALLAFAFSCGVADCASRAQPFLHPYQWRTWYDPKLTSGGAPGHKAAADALNDALISAVSIAKETLQSAEDATRSGGGFGHTRR